MWIYLKKNQVRAMHAYLVQKHGGLDGLRDEGLLESALAQPRQSAFGEDLYADVYSKAAAYGYSLSENQPFIDGNKRVAAAVMGTFMMVNGYALTATNEELYGTVMRLANRKLNRAKLTLWLKGHSKRMKK